MPERNIEFALRWLEKAEHDLITARHTLAVSDGPTDTPSFHAQQAMEKSLKGLLTAHDAAFTKTHDLMPLLDMAAPFLPGLEKWRESFAKTTGYSVEVRYPGDWIDPDRADVESALTDAENVTRIVKQHILAQVNGALDVPPDKAPPAPSSS